MSNQTKKLLNELEVVALGIEEFAALLSGCKGGMLIMMLSSKLKRLIKGLYKII